MTPLPALLDRRAPVADLGRALDDLAPDDRSFALAGLSRAEQRAMYELAGPCDLDAFAPGAAPVPHRGWNTLPVPTSGRRFTKWMIRAGGGVGGYNDSPLRWLVGPGYFTLRATAGDERAHGTVVVDYFGLPPGPFPVEWPWKLPNWLGGSAFVYGWCRDYMRRVNDDVTIGAAFKFGVPVGSWFVLQRVTPPGS